MRAPIVIAAGLLAVSLATAAHAQVVVSSKIDTEGGVLGNIILLALENADIPTTDRIQLGATPVVRGAITAGEIDIYPEYTGNAAFFFNLADDPLWKDGAAGYTRRSVMTSAGLVRVVPWPGPPGFLGPAAASPWWRS